MCEPPRTALQTPASNMATPSRRVAICGRAAALEVPCRARPTLRAWPCGRRTRRPCFLAARRPGKGGPSYCECLKLLCVPK